MRKKINWLLAAVFLLIFLKSLVWLIITPLWQEPDEPAHFSRVQAFAESGLIWPQKENHYSKELAISVEKLEIPKFVWGTATDFGKYRIPYTDNLSGKYEEEIRKIAFSERTNYIATSSAWALPPPYYILSSVPYKIAEKGSIIERAFAIRLFSLFLGLLTVWFAYLTSGEIFGKGSWKTIVFLLCFAFQPMFSFIGIAINIDNLVNLLSVIFIYFLIKYAKTEFNLKRILLLIIIGVLGVAAKPNFGFILVFLFVFLLIKLILDRRYLISLTTLLGPVLILFLSSMSSGNDYYKQFVFFLFDQIISGKIFNSIYVYIINNLSSWKGFVFQTFWGGFGWADTYLPYRVYQLLQFLTLVGLAGGVLKIYRLLKNRRIVKNQLENGLIISSFLVINLLFAVFFDWWMFTYYGRPFGIQGRYLFTSLLPFLLVIFGGLLWYFPKNLEKMAGFFLAFSMIFLNVFSLKVVINRFYTASNLSMLIVQISQYKPVFFKGNFLLGLFFVSIVTLVFVVYRLLLELFQKSRL